MLILQFKIDRWFSKIEYPLILHKILYWSVPNFLLLNFSSFELGFRITSVLLINFSYKTNFVIKTEILLFMDQFRRLTSNVFIWNQNNDLRLLGFIDLFAIVSTYLEWYGSCVRSEFWKYAERHENGKSKMTDGKTLILSEILTQLQKIFLWISHCLLHSRMLF